MNKPNRNISITSAGLTLAAAMAIAGCNERDGNDRAPDLPATCPAPCNIDIELPQDVTQPPKAPAITVVDANSEVIFRLPQGGGQAPGRTVLSFDAPAFLGNNNKPVYTLVLAGAANRYKAAEGVCKADTDPEKNGCRYVVINVGTADRPSVISSPRVIIR